MSAVSHLNQSACHEQSERMLVVKDVLAFLRPINFKTRRFSIGVFAIAHAGTVRIESLGDTKLDTARKPVVAASAEWLISQCQNAWRGDAQKHLFLGIFSDVMIRPSLPRKDYSR
jgi:hypothetical protein